VARHRRQHRRPLIAVLGGLADVERDLILIPHSHRRGPQPGAEAQAAQGPAAEIDAGVTGRGPPATAEDATLAELARSYGVGKSTISRL
jgi:hypothetical protein